MRRVTGAVLLVITVFVTDQGKAWADSGGGVIRGGNGGQVIVSAPGSGGGGSPAPGGGGDGNSSSGGGSTGAGGGRPVSMSNCTYIYEPAPMYGANAQYRTHVCGGVRGPSVLFTPGPAGPGAAPGTPPPPPPPPPSGAEVAQVALASFTLMTPSVGTTSDGGVVRFPQWFWLNRGWVEQSASASVRGVSATVVARPVRALWQPGDGSSFSCDNPGMVYRGPQDAHLRPSCSHEFTRSSALEPGQRYRVSARVSFHMTWSSTDGTSGDLGVITSPAGSASAAVGEIQAVNVPNPGGP